MTCISSRHWAKYIDYFFCQFQRYAFVVLGTLRCYFVDLKLKSWTRIYSAVGLIDVCECDKVTFIFITNIITIVYSVTKVYTLWCCFVKWINLK